MRRASITLAGSLSMLMASAVVSENAAHAQPNGSTAPATMPQPSPATCILRGHHARIELPVTGTAARSAELYFMAPAVLGGAAWYHVPAVRKPDRWVAILPRPVSAARVYYRLVATDGSGKVVTHSPVRGAYIADVVDKPCSTGTAPTEASAAISLSVPEGKSRVPPGFSATNITTFIAPLAAPIANTAQPPGRAGSPTPPARRLALRSGSYFRITGRNGVRHTGMVTQATDSGVRLGSNATLSWSDITRVEEYEPPGAGSRILGALAGLAGGFALSIVYYVAAEDADSATPLYVGTIGGAVIGALVVGGRWQTVAFPRSAGAKTETPIKWLVRRTYVVPQPGGASAGLTLQF